MSISIIIPVYNEEMYVEEIIRRVNSIKIEKEIIVINDGSTDKSLEKLNNLKIDNLKIIDNHTNKGKGFSINCALKYVTKKFVISKYIYFFLTKFNL